MPLHNLLRVAIALMAGSTGYAQFTAGLLANESYWSDGKAEFDIYDAQLMRDGEGRHCEVLHIFSRDRIDAKTFARVEDPKRTDVIRAVRMQQIWTAPIGMSVEQGSLTALWVVEPFSLGQLNFIGTDSFGNIARRLERQGDSWNSMAHTYRDGTSNVAISPPPNAIWYDELPLRVRTIDFTKAPGEFEVSVAPSIIAPVKGDPFAPAKISWKRAEKSFEVTVRHANGSDRFLLDGDFPFLLREWNMADGSKLKLKRGLKADYWRYNKNGDRERALRNPMLEHPD